jgi:hypothetical protein
MHCGMVFPDVKCSCAPRVFDLGCVFACVRGLQFTHRLALLCEEKSGHFCYASQSCAMLLFIVRALLLLESRD